MTEPSILSVEKLELSNWRCFESLHIDLHPEFTLLIGENASGKTSLLEALATALGGVLWYLPDIPPPSRRTIQKEDVRFVTLETGALTELQRRYPCGLLCSGRSADNWLMWSMNWAGDNRKIDRSGMGALERKVDEWQGALQRNEPQPLPVLAYYGTSRLWSVKKEKKPGQKVAERFDGYVDALDPASNLKQLTAWMAKQTYAMLQRRVEHPQLMSISRAVTRCIGGNVRAFFYDVGAEELRVTLNDGTLVPVTELSDGYRAMIAMVADIAWRAVTLNPFYGYDAAALASGLVLIDEIDLHLHPAWQRRAIGDLRRVFPRMQFVGTTHSPQIISSAKREWLRVMRRDGRIFSPDYVEGRDSNAILSDVMGDRPRPAEMEEKLQRLFSLIDDDRMQEARAMVVDLEALLGPEDTELVRARWMIQGLGDEIAAD